MNSLPDACLLSVFSFLPSSDLLACSRVCKLWHAVSFAPILWRNILSAEAKCPLIVQPDFRQQVVRARSCRVYTWGVNALQLSSGSAVPRFTAPIELAVIPTQYGALQLSALQAGGFRWAPVRFVAAGEDWAVLVTWEGALLDSRTVRAAAGPHRHPRPLEVPPAFWPFQRHPVRALAAAGAWSGAGKTGGHATAITADGNVWVWGANESHQLGTGSSDEWLPSPWQALPSDQDGRPAVHAVAVACGERHTAIVTDAGALLTAGNNERGVCCHPPDFIVVPVFSQVQLGGHRSVAVAASACNTVVATREGQVLVAGDNEFGQCGDLVPSGPGACSHELQLLGPTAAWHGMQRQHQSPAGGGGSPAGRVVQVAASKATIYARTDTGNLFAWGSGAQGELGIGGNCKATATPSKMPWAHGIVSISGACEGRWAAAVDTAGKLYTFGAGRSGQLGHGDTAKRTVGRVVKGMAGQAVQAVACGAEFGIAVTAWRPLNAASHHRPPPSSPRSPSSQGQAQAVAEGFRYLQVEPSSPRSPPTSAAQRRGSGGASDSYSPGTPRSSRRDLWRFDEDTGSTSSSSRAVQREKRAQNRRAATGATNDASLGNQPQRTSQSVPQARELGVEVDSFAPFALDEDDPYIDDNLRKLIFRQLRAFATDHTRQQLELPSCLTSADRYKVHRFADEWGLEHYSHGTDRHRRIVVMKRQPAR